MVRKKKEERRGIKSRGYNFSLNKKRERKKSQLTAPEKDGASIPEPRLSGSQRERFWGEGGEIAEFCGGKRHPFSVRKGKKNSEWTRFGNRLAREKGGGGKKKRGESPWTGALPGRKSEKGSMQDDALIKERGKEKRKGRKRFERGLLFFPDREKKKRGEDERDQALFLGRKEERGRGKGVAWKIFRISGLNFSKKGGEKKGHVQDKVFGGQGKSGGKKKTIAWLVERPIFPYFRKKTGRGLDTREKKKTRPPEGNPSAGRGRKGAGG